MITLNKIVNDDTEEISPPHEKDEENFLSRLLLPKLSVTFVGLKPITKKLEKEMDKNFGLSEEEFTIMAEQLKAGDQALFEKIFLAHVKHSITYLIRKYRASYEDAYDRTMDTLLGFRDRLIAGKISYGNLAYLFTKMASQKYIRQAKQGGKLTAIEDNLDIEEEITETDQSLLPILNISWKKLGEKCQELLKQFYYQKIPLNEIAEKTGKSYPGLRKQKQRCIDKLREVFIAHYDVDTITSSIKK